MFFGWGSNSFVFPIAFGEKWYVMGENRSDDRQLSYAQVKELVPENTPKLGLWTKWGLLLTIGFLVALSLVINLFKMIVK
jgi:hypothetical protein